MALYYLAIEYIPRLMSYMPHIKTNKPGNNTLLFPPFPLPLFYLLIFPVFIPHYTYSHAPLRSQTVCAKSITLHLVTVYSKMFVFQSTFRSQFQSRLPLNPPLSLFLSTPQRWAFFSWIFCATCWPWRKGAPTHFFSPSLPPSSTSPARSGLRPLRRSSPDSAISSCPHVSRPALVSHHHHIYTHYWITTVQNR